MSSPTAEGRVEPTDADAVHTPTHVHYETAEAYRRFLPPVYAELRRIARRQLRRLRPGETLGTTVLVHEAYLKLAGRNGAAWLDRSHFFAIAARAMRQVLVNYALRQQAIKRGGRDRIVALDASAELPAPEPEARLLALDGALDRLEALDERLARIVECRFFAGLTEEETAASLGVSLRTVQRDWKLARGWLHEELAETP